jgi:tetratricopeptide (TPR) repeat protein
MDADEKLLHKYHTAEKWDKAVEVCRCALKKEPDSHWWYIHLGISLIETGSLKAAQKAFDKADKIKKNCPLVQWYYGVLQYEKKNWALALDIFQNLHNRCVRKLNSGDYIDFCWESVKRAEELDNDCRGRIGFCWLHLGNEQKAAWWLKKHMDNRKKGRFSQYSAKVVRGYLRDMGWVEED